MADTQQRAAADAEMAEALAQVMSMYRYDISAIEGEAWRAVMRAAVPGQFTAFLQSHILSGSAFPPRPGDASKALGLVVDPDAAFLMVQRLAREHGPYQDPAIADPVLITAVQYMGGWCTLCEELPDAGETFAMKGFKERFIAAFNQASSAVNVRKQLPAQPLVSLASRRAMAALGHSPQARLANAAAGTGAVPPVPVAPAAAGAAAGVRPPAVQSPSRVARFTSQRP